MTEGISFLTGSRVIHGDNQTYMLLIGMVIFNVMNSLDDTTTTEGSEPTGDKLVFLNGKEQLKYLRGKREYRGKKNKVGSIIEYVRNFIKF